MNPVFKNGLSVVMNSSYFIAFVNVKTNNDIFIQFIYEFLISITDPIYIHKYTMCESESTFKYYLKLLIL